MVTVAGGHTQTIGGIHAKLIHLHVNSKVFYGVLGDFVKMWFASLGFTLSNSVATSNLSRFENLERRGISVDQLWVWNTTYLPKKPCERSIFCWGSHPLFWFIKDRHTSSSWLKNTQSTCNTSSLRTSKSSCLCVICFSSFSRSYSHKSIAHQLNIFPNTHNTHAVIISGIIFHPS